MHGTIPSLNDGDKPEPVQPEPVQPELAEQTAPARQRWNLSWISAPFFLVHVLCFAAIWTGVSWVGLTMCVVLYVVRMFAVTGVYHRYFSHRTYRMNRVMQFLMGFLAETSAQKGVLWWAAHHRHHHRHSDDPEDAHSPRQKGFWYAHFGWIVSKDTDETNYAAVPDLARFPELRWLNRWHQLPPWLLGTACYFIAGWEGLVVGFFWSTVLLWHGTFTINSLSHIFGKQAYQTGDDSKNNWFLALVTLGEGWHNNHHFYQSCTRQGFRWWQIDITYMILRTMAVFRLVSDLKEPPERIVAMAGKHLVDSDASDEELAKTA